MRIAAILLVALAILGSTAYLRAPEYDEAYSIFLTAGHVRPAWPTGPFHPADTRFFYQGNASPQQIAHDLREYDVHPPLYFWLLEYWRRCFGPSWFAARMLSVCLSILTLAGIATAARVTQIPASPAILIALLGYGFAYTGIVARGFALAQALNMLGIVLILHATRTHARRLGLAAGLAFGAAAFSNYLAVFIAVAALFWLCLDRQRHRILAPAALGLSAFFPALIFFFLAQHNSRIGQFQAFSLSNALPRLGKDFGAAWFGGLPVYAGHAGRIVTAALFLLAAICVGFIVKNRQEKLSLFALCVLAVPAGLLALGLIFNNTPIEIRYLAFAMPFLALLLAETLPPAWCRLLLTAQALGIIGLALAPSTMQPQAIAAHQLSRLNMPNALVLLPFGNDGVGIPGPFIATAPAGLRLQLIKPETQPSLSAEHQIILVSIGIDASSKRTSARMLAQLSADPCWSHGTSTPLLNAFVRTCKNH